MNTKTDITHRYSHLTVNVKHNSQTITQITKRYFSYQLFVIGAVMTKACGGSSGDGGGDTINGGTPINIDNGIDVMIAQYTVGTPIDLIDTSGDDTYIIDYTQVSDIDPPVSGTDPIALQVIEGAGGASGYDTVIIQGYPENSFIDIPFSSNINLYISHDSNPDITFTFASDNSFERFIFDIKGDGQINGNDFTWLIGNRNVNNVIEGTNVKDYIHTWNGDDIIYGNAGDDYIEGGAGIDKIYGGAGNNIIYGNAGNDHIYGGTGNEEIYGGAGNDFIFGSGGDDTIDGGAEFDYIDGGGGDDTIYGNAGDDIIYGGLGNDTIYGGGGNDKIRYKKGEGHDIIDGGAGDDDVLGLREFVVGDILSIEQTGQDLTLIFKDNAQGGSVTLKDSINNDARGIDEILFDTNASGVEDAGDTIWLDDYFERDIATSNILYTIHGDDGNDEIYGNDEDNILNGGDGDDTINGYGGDDTIDGGLGIDTIYGGLGIDTIYGEAGNDIIYGNEGIDTIYGGAGNDIISGGDGNDTIFYNKSDGNDEIFGDAGNDVLILVGFVEDDVLSIERTGNDLKLIFKDSSQGGSIILKDSFYDDEQGIDKIVFDTDSNGEDTGDIIWLDNDFERNIATSNIPYTIYGTAGDDTIYGGTGDNRIVYNKGGGDDILEVGDGDDVLILVGFVEEDVLRIERTGQDLTLIFKDSSQGGSIILKNSFNDDATGIDKIVFDTNENGQDSTDIIWLDDDASFEGYITTSNIPYAIYGTAGADTITGSLGNDIINGGAGIDTIKGGTGNDTILGGEGNDIIYGGEGNDYIYGGAGFDIIHGGAGDDTIDGGAGDDTIRYKKGEGHDIIDGGDGVDTLILVGFDEGDIENLVQTGDDLKLNFKDTPEGEDGGSVTLENSINYNQTGIDKIVFDADGETIWQDEDFADYLLLPIYMA